MGRKVAFMAHILDKTGVVISNRQLSDRLWIIDIKVDALGADLMPGQFVHMLIPGMEGHILRRPFSVFYVSEDGSVITILYQVVGFGSKHLTTVEAGMAVSLMGPIGHGWNAPEGVSSALLVAGGVGAAPLFLHAQELVLTLRLLWALKAIKLWFASRNIQNFLGTSLTWLPMMVRVGMLVL